MDDHTKIAPPIGGLADGHPANFSCLLVVEMHSGRLVVQHYIEQRAVDL